MSYSSKEIRCHKEEDIVFYPSCKDIPKGSNGKYLFEIDDEADSNVKICSSAIQHNCLSFITNNNRVKIWSTFCDKRYKKGEECLDDYDG